MISLALHGGGCLGWGATQVDASEGPPNGVYIAAKEVESIAPGASVDVDTDDLAFPNGFSTLPPGDVIGHSRCLTSITPSITAHGDKL
jgi:hypothetical protein